MIATIRWLTVVLVMIAMPAWSDVRPFNAKSLDAIRQANTGKPFVLAFWSVYCDPCREEMGQWTPLQRKYPNIPIVLVATDQPGDKAMQDFLRRHDLRGIQLWVFDDEFTERVRFAVDRTWRGELPRTYVFDAAHRTEARSGANMAWIETWLARQAARTTK